MNKIFPVRIVEGDDPYGMVRIGSPISWKEVMEMLAHGQEIKHDPKQSEVEIAADIIRRGREATLAILGHELAHLIITLVHGVEHTDPYEEVIADFAGLFVLGLEPLPEKLVECVKHFGKTPEDFRRWVELHLAVLEAKTDPIPPMETSDLEKFVHEFYQLKNIHENNAQRDQSFSHKEL